MPNPPKDGGCQVMHYTTLGLLANGVNVKTLAINPSRNLIDVNVLSKEYIQNVSFESVNVDTKIKPLKILLNLFKKESYFIERFISDAFKDKITQILKKGNYEIIQLEHLYLCKYIDTIRKYSSAKIILRPQNVEYVIWERYLISNKNPVKKFVLKIATKRLKAFEQSINNKVDGIIALTKQDNELFLSFNKNVKSTIISMGFDYEKLCNYDFQKQVNSKPMFYHLASMDWLPNIEAVQWFIQNVIPIIEKNNTELKIIIAGRNMPKWVYKHKSNILEVIDEVKAPLSFQEDKQIMIVPLWSGSGIRAKIIEGLALGKVIISTTIGAQGIDYTHNENILIADTPEDFYKQMIRCLKSEELRNKLTVNSRKLSIEKYNHLNTAKKMIEFYKECLYEKN